MPSTRGTSPRPAAGGRGSSFESSQHDTERELGLAASTPVGNMSLMAFGDKTPSAGDVANLGLRFNFVSPSGHSFAPSFMTPEDGSGQGGGAHGANGDGTHRGGAWRTIIDFKGFAMDPHAVVVLRRADRASDDWDSDSGLDDGADLPPHAAPAEKREERSPQADDRTATPSPTGSDSQTSGRGVDGLVLSSPQPQGFSPAGVREIDADEAERTWSAVGSTGRVTLTTLAAIMAPDTPSVAMPSIGSTLRSPLAKPAPPARPLMAFKAVRHAGQQGTSPGERDAAFAGRAIDFQLRVSAAQRLDPEQFNLDLAFRYGVVLPAAVRVQVDSTSVIMPFMPGGSVGDLLRVSGGEGPVGEGIARQVLRGAACGLDVLHRRLGAIHHDLTPDNILLAAAAGPDALASPSHVISAGDSTVLCAAVADFGCTSLVSTEVLEGPGREVACTDFVGSIRYMSPERLAGEPHGPSSDVWSLGVVALSLALGRFPFLLPSRGDASAASGDASTLPPLMTSDERSPSDTGRRRSSSAALSLGDSGSSRRDWSAQHAASVAAAAQDGDEGVFWKLAETLGASEADLHVRSKAVDDAVTAALAASSSSICDAWRDTIRACLQGDPRQRPTAAEILRSPFLSLPIPPSPRHSTAVPDPADPPPGAGPPLQP